MEVDDSASCLYRPHMEAENQRLDVTVKDLQIPSIGERESIHEVDDSQAENQRLEVTVKDLEIPSIGERESIHEVDESQRVGAPVVVAAGSVVGVETKTEAMIEESGGGGKRKRGRPSRAQARPKMKMEEEDVCFICFDGGSLVLCDRRSCPKAYHPACIKRDEAFFRSRGRWNCGWHICSSCQKAAHYMCYTCTFSLCKGCTKDADYVCVRGNKGFCTTCLKTIMLIENNEQGNNKTDQVDFDDKTSWEYLFKIYWIYLKESLSLTFNELTNAKNPWKESGTTIVKRQFMDLHDSLNDGKGSDKSVSEIVTTSIGSPIMSLSSLKPPEVVGDHAASPTSNGFQLTHSTPFDPSSNACSWQAIFGEPIEFSTLAEESVSDLLAEVDAMESQGGLPSPTSVMKCGEELIQGPKNDSLSSVGGLNPTADPVKSDAMTWKFGIEHE